MGYSGLFLALEGVDGCGKSTQTQLVAQWLSQVTGRNIVTTREPGGTALGVTLRQLIQHGEEMDARTEALLYAADRAHHVATLIRPALLKGEIVVTDRYLDSSVAYKAAGRQLPAAQVENLSLWATDNMVPDITLLIDIDPEVARTRQTGELDRIEKAGISFQTRVRAGYLERVAANPNRWVVVPGTGSIEQVFAAIQTELAPRIAAWQQQLGLVP